MLRYARSEDGASAAEYAIILSVVGAGVAVALFALGGSISNAFGNATGVVSQVASATPEANDPVPSIVQPDPTIVEPPAPPVVPSPPANNGSNGNHHCGGNNGNGKGNTCTN